MSLKILVADDEPHILRLVQVNLEREGYHVLTAGDGRQALEQAQMERPALIILDVMMPHMDGFAVLEKLKASPELREIPVLMLTAKRHDADLLQGHRSGADRYLTKPFNPAELVETVRGLFGESTPVGDQEDG